MATEVLLISESRISTVQLLEQMLEQLEETTTLRTRARLLKELQPEDVTPGTYPVLVRSCNLEAHRLTQHFRRHGVRYGFYIDDNFWLLDPDTPIGQHYAATEMRGRLDDIVRRAHTVIASTPLLHEFLRPRARRVVQLDSFFDFDLIPELPPPPPERGVVRGGFAASSNRGPDLQPVIADLLAVLDAHQQVEFEVIGIEDALPAHPRIRTFPYRQSYADYIDFQLSRQWDFAVAPLGGAHSNPYKTDNKYREYAAQGIPGVYQESPPYALVRDGETGLLAGPNRSWREAIEQYVLDPELRGRVRVSAREDAFERGSLERVAPQWARFFETAPVPGAARATALGESIAELPSRRSRAAERRHLLWLYGRTELQREGFFKTARRTLKFVAKRIVGQ